MNLLRCLDKPLTSLSPSLGFFYIGAPSLPLLPASCQGKQQISGPKSCPLFDRLFLVLAAHRFVQGPGWPCVTLSPPCNSPKQNQRSLSQARALGFRAARPNGTDLFFPVPRTVPALAIGFLLLLLLLQSLSLNIFDFLQLFCCLSHGWSDCSPLQSSHLHFPGSTPRFLPAELRSPR